MKKREKVYNTFQSIAAGYDQANHRISLGLQTGWKKRMLAIINRQNRTCKSALDVCCGTGDICRMLAARYPSATITGIDFSEAMLKIARRKSKNPGIIFRQGDAMRLPFADDFFDLATISFGLRNTEDYKRVLSEMKRVVRPGGYVYCIDSFVPENPIVKPFYKLYFRYIMPLLGGGRRHYKEYVWLYESTKAFLSPRQLENLYREIGLKRVGSRTCFFGSCAIVYGRI